jgi:CRP/FNR family cyclic AMP-dependent transcriptional regulator
VRALRVLSWRSQGDVPKIRQVCLIEIGMGEANGVQCDAWEWRMPEAKSSFRQLLGPGFPTRNLSKGKTIFQEGDRGDEFFIVVRGQVEIVSGDRHLETLEADGIFGEMALIDDSPRSATAVALTDVILAPIKENQFLFLVQNAPFFALSVMRVLARRLRRQNKAA